MFAFTGMQHFYSYSRTCSSKLHPSTRTAASAGMMRVSAPSWDLPRGLLCLQLSKRFCKRVCLQYVTSYRLIAHVSIARQVEKWVLKPREDSSPTCASRGACACASSCASPCASLCSCGFCAFPVRTLALSYTRSTVVPVPSVQH